MSFYRAGFGEGPGIYMIKSPVSDECYVGSSIHVNKRLRQHFMALRRGDHHSYKLQAAYAQYGDDLQSYVIRTVRACTLVRNPSLLADLEDEWLDTTNCCYNVSTNAESPASDPATRRKISKALTGRKFSAARRRAHTERMRDPEVNARRSAALKGRRFTKAQLREHRERMRSAKTRANLRRAWRVHRKGYVVSAEARAKISASLTGRFLLPETKRKLSRALKGTRLALTKKQMAFIRRNHDRSRRVASYYELAEQLGVGWCTVFKVVNRKGVYA